MSACLPISPSYFITATSVLQVELNVLYNAFEVSAASVRLEVSSAANPSRKATQVLYPLRISLSLRKGKLPDRLLPQTRVQVSVDPLEVSLTPEQMETLHQLVDMEHGDDPLPAQKPAASSCAEWIDRVNFFHFGPTGYKMH